MKFYLDTEFYDGMSQQTFLGLKINEPKHVIDLISIAIVNEKGDKYYAICNEFNFKQAWENKWLKNNVLKTIVKSYAIPILTLDEDNPDEVFEKQWSDPLYDSKYAALSRQCIKRLGKSKEEIKEDIIAFTKAEDVCQFYGYYSSYDWVLLCSIFGKLLNLPSNFRWNCYDVKQKIDYYNTRKLVHKDWLNLVYGHDKCPIKPVSHNALEDAIYIKELNEFLNEHIEPRYCQC